jgi:hypothetical protein
MTAERSMPKGPRWSWQVELARTFAVLKDNTAGTVRSNETVLEPSMREPVHGSRTHDREHPALSLVKC